jgi:hypothetical protein
MLSSAILNRVVKVADKALTLTNLDHVFRKAPAMNRSPNFDDEKSQASLGQTEPKALVTRRRFMTLFGGGVASIAVQGCGGGGANGGEPGGAVSMPLLVMGGNPAPSGPAIASFQLKSASGGISLPFTLGYAFKKGQVPGGARLVGSITDLQVVPKNAWPDGSLKFAIVSGRATMVAGTPLTVTLSLGTPTSASSLTTENLRLTGATASIGAGSFGTVSWTSADWATPFMTWVSGPFMSSWLYRKPIGTDAHLVGWLEVRLYRGGAVEILPWIENGYLNVARPTSKNATYTFDLGGRQRFNAAIDLPNHSRTVLVSGTTLSHWLGDAPQVTPNHDKAYLQSTGLVPTYRTTVSSSAAVWSSLPGSFQPLQQGNYSGEMGQTGYQPAIGILPEWDVLYLVSDDARALPGVIMHAYGAGRFGTHYRDENTLRPIRFSSYPNLVVNGGGSTGIANTGASSRESYTPTSSGTTPPTWDIPHHPSIAFTSYLLTGRFYFMEEVQFTATVNYLINTDITRKFSAGVFLTNAGTNTTRGAGWALRTLAQAACVTPDDDPLRPEFVASMAANVDFYHSTYVAQQNNPYGIVQPYSNYTAGSGKYSEAAWMQDFFTAAVGYAIDVDPGMNAASNGKLSEFFRWKAQSVIGRLGGTAQTEFLYRDAAQYTLCVAPSDNADFANGTGPWYANWGEIYRATLGTANPGVDGPLRGGNYPDPSSYWGNLQPAIAYAVRHNVAGAMAAYTRMLAASNWNDIATGFAMAPVWAVAPSVVAPAASVPTKPAPSLPQWVPPVGYFADVPMLNNPTDVMPAVYRGSPTDTAAMDNPFIMWGGSAVLRDFSALGAQVYYSGGHETGSGIPNIQMSLVCDFSTLTWSVANVPLQPNASGSFLNGYAADGTSYAPHSYLGLQELPKAWGGGAQGSLVSFFWAGSTYENRINVLDVTRPTLGYTQLATRQPQNIDPSKIRFSAASAGGNYPITVMDADRRGWWVAVDGTVSYTLFVSSTGDITQYPALGGNLASGSMVLCNSLNLLVAVDGGYDSGAYAGTGYRTLYLRNLSTGVVTTSLTAGPVPSVGDGYDGGSRNFHRPDALGLQWVEELGCVVGFDQSVTPPAIVKLTPPASNPATGTWTWSTVPVAHWDQDTNGQSALQTSVNNVWSKFRWVPSLHAFVYATGKDRKPQVIRIA